MAITQSSSCRCPFIHIIIHGLLCFGWQSLIFIFGCKARDSAVACGWLWREVQFLGVAVFWALAAGVKFKGFVQYVEAIILGWRAQSIHDNVLGFAFGCWALGSAVAYGWLWREFLGVADLGLLVAEVTFQGFVAMEGAILLVGMFFAFQVRLVG